MSADRSLLTYSLVRALYDEGRDYIDSFWPFVLRVLPDSGAPRNLLQISESVASEYGLSVPLHTVRTLAERARKAYGYLTKKGDSYGLSEKGIAYNAQSETPRQVERRLNHFISEASDYLGKIDPEFLDRAHTEEIIRSVVERNYHVFDYLVERPTAYRDGEEAAEEAAVLRYFAHVESADPSGFNTLRDLILGSTIAGLVRRTDISDVERHFRNTRMYLDTNFVLSILGLRHSVDCRPAEELLGLINRTTGISLCVYDYTLQEVFGVLRGFAVESRKYPRDVPIDSIYASMRARGFTPARVTELIASIDKELETYGIHIITTGLNLQDLREETPGSLEVLARYKPNLERGGLLHDLVAIEMIAKERKRPRYRIEEPEAFLLTEDYRLSNYSLVERGHQANGTVSEVLPDRVLTNLLWLKHPDMLEDLPIEVAIALHSRDLFINRHVWIRFHDVVQDLHVTGRLDEESAAVLIYDAQVHRDLAALGVSGAARIDPEWALSELDAVRDRLEEESVLELKEQQEHLAAEHQRVLSDQEGRSRRTIDGLTAERNSLSNVVLGNERRRNLWVRQQREIAEGQADIAVAATKGSIVLCIGAALIFAWSALGSAWRVLGEAVESIAFLATLILAGLGWKIDPGGAYKRLRASAADWLLQRRLRQELKYFGPRMRRVGLADGAEANAELM